MLLLLVSGAAGKPGAVLVTEPLCMTQGCNVNQIILKFTEIHLPLPLPPELGGSFRWATECH